MAQEIIYGAHHGTEYQSQHHDENGLPVGEPVTKVIHDPRIEISWSNEAEYLQLGVVHPSEDGDYASVARPPDADDGWLREAFRTYWESDGRKRYVEDGSDPKQNEAWSAYWAGILAQREIESRSGRAVFLQLTRAAANRLIRAVRTGRDKAYGKDE